MRRDQPCILLVQGEKKNLLASAKRAQKYQVQLLCCNDVEAAKAVLSHVSIDAVGVETTLSASKISEGENLTHFVANHFPQTLTCLLKEDAKMAAVSKKTNGAACFSFHAVEEFFAMLAEKSLIKRADKHHVSDVKFIETFEDLIKPQKIGVAFQPIATCSCTEKQTLLGIESLARPKTEGLPLSPEVLFSYASFKDQLFETDMICIKAALSQVKSWRKRPLLFVNVRPLSLVGSRFLDSFWPLIEEHEIPPENMVFELTEQSAILNIKSVLQSIENLRQAGIRIAIDDFGVGFSNLSMLYDIKPDFIKISGFFSNNLSKDKLKQAMVRSICDLANILNIATILENVENKSDLLTAQELGVQYAQGFFVGRPQKLEVLLGSKWAHFDPKGPCAS